MTDTLPLFDLDQRTSSLPILHLKTGIVYVDPLMNCMISAAWKWPRSCHMFVDKGTDLEVLHQFAERVGLKRKWFQQTAMPHYDLHQARRRVAVKLGAVELDRRAAVEIIRKWKGR